jgi:large subunit ribosomal protein L31
MNATIHPVTYPTLVRCSTCGAEHALRSVREHLSVEVCCSCHPAYTGQELRVARGGQIARFEARRRLAGTR